MTQTLEMFSSTWMITPTTNRKPRAAMCHLNLYRNCSRVVHDSRS
jgi:hypothetical protein